MARKPQKNSKASTRPSSILNHNYDPATRTLTVTFRGERTYQYQDVPPEIVAGLAKAPSKGAFMHASVLGKFDATKL